MSKALLMLAALLSAQAYGWDYPETHGYQIDLKTSGSIAQKSGTSASIIGTISNVSSGIKANQQTILLDLLRQITGDDLKVKAYFPDFTHEVTSDVKLKQTSQGLSLTYQTPKLSSTDLNTLIVQVSRPSKAAEDLLFVKAKLQFNILFLNFFLQDYEKHKGKPAIIDELKSEIASLTELEKSIDQKIASFYVVVAETTLPLQVDNVTAQPAHKSYVLNHFRYSIQYDLGSAIQGESTNATGTISWADCENHHAPDSKSKFAANFVWNGTSVHQEGPQTLSSGQSIQFTYKTGKLSSAVSNLFTETLTQSVTSGKNTQTQTIGALALNEPVAADSTPPIWLAGATPDSNHPYVQSAQPISAQIQDAFGRIDPTSLSAVLTKTDLAGKTISTDLSKTLRFTTADGGISYSLAGDLSSLSEGHYTLSYSAADLAGQRAQAPTVNFQIDRTPPTLTLSMANVSYTNQSSFPLSIAISDDSPTTASITLNGAQIAQTRDQNAQFTLKLSEGKNDISVGATDSAGNASSVKTAQITLVTKPPVVTLGSSDNILTNKKSFTLPISVVSAAPATTQVFFNGIQIASKTEPSFSVTVDLQEGKNTFSALSIDAAGNKSDVIGLTNITLDDVSPTIFLGASDNQLTRISSFTLPITITDASPVDTRVFQNGVQIYQSSNPFISIPITLAQGLNVFKITAIDSAGNQAVAQLDNITFDNIPPTLTNISPAQGTFLNRLSFQAAGRSDEALSSVSVNGVNLQLSGDQQTFAGTVSMPSAGPANLHWIATDLAGNTTQQDISIQIVLTVLNSSLLSVIPDTDGNHLNVVGSPGASAPGAKISVSAGFFNTGSGTSADDGSFKIQMSAFKQATVTAYDNFTGQSASATVSFGSNSSTVLAGVVKDVDGKALQGATVSILNTKLTAQTDETGTFQLAASSSQAMVTGDQTLQIDGSTSVQAPLPAVQKLYSKVNVSISIGVSQSNVLSRPIYIGYVPKDGSGTPVTAGASTVVRDQVSAPGVQLAIPANVTTFPDGSKAGTISLKAIASDNATVTPLKVAVPKTVLALEPSGVTFSKPVELTLPNVNEFPAGTDLLILSMNSSKGIWEVGGIATVSPDGKSVITKDGYGITHFSMVYATPMGPVVGKVGDAAVSGADTFNGALTTSLSLPSYKSLNHNFAPGLVYKSSWAHPSALITATISNPIAPISVTKTNALRDIFGVTRGIVSTSATSTLVPESIKSTFSTTGIQSSSADFEGSKNTLNIQGQQVTYTGIPDNALLAYSLELKDPSTGAYLASGIYPYKASYEINYKELTVYSQHVQSFDPIHVPETTQVGFLETNAITQAFPPDLTGPIYVQNQTQSSTGRGWRIQGPQRIVNPTSGRVLLEESDGSISSYALDDSVSTLYNANGSNVDLSLGVDLTNWPNAYVINSPDTVDPSNKNVGTVDLSQSSPSFQTIGAIGDKGTLLGAIQDPNPSSDGSFCTVHEYSYNAIPNASALVQMNGKVFGTLAATSQLFQLDQGTYTDLVNPPVVSTFHYFDCIRYYWNYGTLKLPECLNSARTGLLSSGIFVSSNPLRSYTVPADGAISRHPNIQVHCNAIDKIVVSKTWFHENSTDGPLSFPWDLSVDESTIPGLNSPMGITQGANNTLVVADRGNNKIRLVDLNAKTISTIAGNGTTYDTGDNGPALQAGIYHPRGLAYDSLGNLYITTEGGLVRRIDASTGKISTIIGGAGATPGDNLPGTSVLLSNPTGVIVDNTNGILYIAETGANVIRKYDLQTKIISTIAGNYVAGYNGDQAALNTSFMSPTWLGLDSNQNLLVVDSGNSRIRRINFSASLSGRLAFQPANHDNSKLSRNPDGTWTRILRNGTQTNFDSSGRQISSVDRFGQIVSLSYDSQGRLTAASDSIGQTTFYNYSGSNLQSIKDPAGRITKFLYDGNNNLTSVILPDGSSKSYTYTSDGLMLTETNERGNTTHYSYNQYGRLISVTRADQSVVAISDSSSQIVGNNYTNGNTGALYSYGTGKNQVYEGIKDAKSVETKFTKDRSGFITNVTDANGNITQIDRDILGNPTKVTRPDNSTVTFSYDPNTYDLISQTDTATNITTSQTFDQFGNVLTQTNGRGFRISRKYDSITGALLSQTDPMGHTVSYTFDQMGLKKTQTDALGKVTTFSYDSHGNLQSTTDPLGRVTSYVRDDAGNAVQVKDPAGHITNYQYDVMNRLASVTTPKGDKTQYVYLPTGEISQIIDPQGNVTNFQYDQLGRLISKTDPAGRSMARLYDGNSNVIQETDPNGNIKTMSYDSLNRLTQKVLPDNIVSLSYDSRGNLAQIKDSVSEIDYNYDVLGRMTSASSKGVGALSDLPIVTLGFNLDENGNRIQLTDPTGSTFYTYDAADRLKSITNPEGEAFQFSYDNGNRLTQILRQGSISSIVFNDANFVSSIVHSARGATLSSFIYERDPLGNLTKITTPQGVRSLAYDANSQLVSMTNPETTGAMSSETFSYDSISNRTADQNGAYTYDSKSQQLTEDYLYRYFFDNNGNLIKKLSKSNLGEVTNYVYSASNQLISIKVYMPGSNAPIKEVTYAYDALGRRIQKKVIDHSAESDLSKSFTRRYIYDGPDILLEYDGTNRFLARYTHSGLGADDVLAVNVSTDGVNAKVAQSSGSYFYLKDAIGTITDICDSNGSILQHYVYSAFGERISIQDLGSHDISANPTLNTSYAFAGREFDAESGFYYNRARYYDPQTGRFLQKDPVPGALGIPLTSGNAYIYGGNNPLRFVDPNGKSFWGGVGFALLAIGVLAASAGTGGIAAIALGAVVAGAVSASIASFQNKNAVSAFITGFAIGAAIGFTGFGLGALLGPGYGMIAGATLGATIGGIAGYKATHSAGGAIAGAILGGWAGAAAAGEGAGLEGLSNTGLQGQAQSPDVEEDLVPYSFDPSEFDWWSVPESSGLPQYDFTPMNQGIPMMRPTLK